MTIVRYMSDLHLELNRDARPTLPSIGEDLVVLAGDIHNGVSGVHWANQMISDRPVVYVLGNHEYYGGRWDLLVDECKAVAAPNVHVLENDYVEINGLTVLGCTLWTDYALFGHDTVAKSMELSMESMYDYVAIWFAERRLFATDVLKRHQRSVAWLTEQLHRQKRPALVVTHHSPTVKNRNPQFNDISNSWFHSDLEHLMDPDKVAAWICGHNHHSAIVEAGPSARPVLVLSNQRGYPSERMQCSAFDWNHTLQIPDPASAS